MTKHFNQDGRDRIGALAGVDGDGNVLSHKGIALRPANDGYTYIYDRDSQKPVLRLKYIDANNYNVYILTNGVWEQIAVYNTDVAGGVALIDSQGNVMSQKGISLKPSDDGYTYIYDRDSSNPVLRIKYVDADNYILYLHTGGQWNPVMSLDASGYVPLDGNGKIDMGYLQVNTANGVVTFNSDIMIDPSIIYKDGPNYFAIVDGNGNLASPKGLVLRPDGDGFTYIYDRDSGNPVLRLQYIDANNYKAFLLSNGNWYEIALNNLQVPYGNYNLDTAYQTPCQGFLVVANNSASGVIKVVYENASNPTWIYGYCGPMSSVSFPVRGGYYWKAATQSGSPTAYINFIPMTTAPL